MSFLRGGKKNERGRGFLSGVSVLTVSALIVKIIGLLYRIPMLSLLGTEGMGYFNTAYELYALFCVVSTAGLPVAMSVLISSSEARGRGERAGKIFSVAMLTFLVVGVVGSLILYGFSDALAGLLKNRDAAAGMRMIAPTVLLICVSSAFRGYFQGKRSMTPTAVSQVIEALGKLLLGLLFASVALRRGCDLPTTAAYAVMGLTVGTGISVLYLWIHKAVLDHRHPSIPAPYAPDGETVSRMIILRRLLATAIPVTLGAGVMGVTKVVDLALILRRLQAAGMDAAAANGLYGCYSTLVLPVFNILPSLTTSVSLSAVPALSAALGKGIEGRAEAKKISLQSLRLTLIITIPAALGLSVFAKDVLTLLFSSQPEAVAMATPWLTCLALSVPGACLITVSGAMLQAVGRATHPVISMLAGTLTKALLAYVLLGIPEIGLMGAPISTLVCDSVIVVLNFIFLSRTEAGILPDLKETAELFLLPTLLSGLSIGLVVLSRRWLGWESVTSLSTVGTVLCVMCLYGAGVWLIWGRKRLSKKITTET